MPRRDTGNQPKLKSKLSQDRAFVRFVNTTSRTVDLIWIDFHGRRVNYVQDGMGPRTTLSVDSYGEHPWISRDHTTGDKLCFASKGEVLFPRVWGGEVPARRHWVYIQLPVYTLTERCFQVIRKLVRSEDIENLEIPQTLKHSLLNPVEDVPIWNPSEHPECVLLPEQANDSTAQENASNQ